MTKKTLNDQIAISVVIPTYNRASTLRRAVRSVLSQSNVNFEVIIVDGGSTDNTEKLIQRMDDHRISFYKYEKRVTVGKNRNKGLELSKGKYITFLDSDDELLSKTALKEIAEKFDSLPADVGMLFYLMRSAVETEPSSPLPFSEAQVDLKGILRLKVQMGRKPEFLTTVRSQLCREVRFFDKANGLEGIFIAKILKMYRGFIVNKPLLLYHTEGEDRLSVTTRGPKELLELGKGLMILLKLMGDEMKEEDPKRYAYTLRMAGTDFLLGGDGKGIELWHRSKEFDPNIKVTLVLALSKILGFKKMIYLFRKYHAYRGKFRFKD